MLKSSPRSVNILYMSSVGHLFNTLGSLITRSKPVPWKWVKLGYLNQFKPSLWVHVKDAMWVKLGFDPPWSGPCERGHSL